MFVFGLYYCFYLLIFNNVCFAIFTVLRGGYQYQENCYEIFEKFFLECNPFFDLCDAKGIELEGSLFGTAFGGMNEPAAPCLKDVKVTVDVTLKEFYCGSHKQVSYDR